MTITTDRTARRSILTLISYSYSTGKTILTFRPGPMIVIVIVIANRRSAEKGSCSSHSADPSVYP